ncbi:MAG: reductive dehalogenase [Deltaproteobacteria bacterium]|nr:reductive dehalogenase [Deltaproteobacteria bacterium]
MISIVMAGLALLALATIGLAYFISSIWEREGRAAVFAGAQLVILAVLVALFIFLWAVGFFETPVGWAVLILGLVLLAAGTFFIVRKSGANPRALEGTRGLIVGQVNRYDEREIVFSRNRYLEPGTNEYKAFYEKHPELEEIDARRRENGGPLGEFGRIDRPHEEPNLAAVIASSLHVMSLSGPERVNPLAGLNWRDRDHCMDPEEASERVKGYARRLGADLVGIAEINPLWIYAYRGQAPVQEEGGYGSPITLDHKYAIVIAMEMALEMVRTAPHTPTTVESILNYSRGATIAVQLASFVSSLGSPATAHHLGHYDGLMVPLAVDAGLGELSRMGYLLSKEYGPRIRLGAVTTSLPLKPDRPRDIGVRDFCSVCKKCAVCCPSGSIPMGDPVEVNGTLRWKLNAETCFAYWGKVGTDCNVCMKVCPWSHARTLPHQLIVEMVSRNRVSRRIFNVMDDIFYGRKPRSRAAPKWAKYD